MRAHFLALVVLVCIAAALVARAQVPPQPTATLWFTQKVNHFDFGDTRTFEQQVLVYDAEWNQEAAGPIFFYTGNEGPIGEFYNNTGFMFEQASTFGALLIFAEHRYYGASLPFSLAQSFSQDGIHYLTVEQACADYATLIPWLKNELGATDSSVVTFGGSYGGMLSAFMRLRYPYVVDMALAASAPILMGASLAPTPGFYEAVTNDFAAVDASCPDLYRAAFAQVLALAAQGPSGLAQITQTFKLCSPLEPSGLNQFIGWAVTAFANLAMADYPVPACFLGCMPAWPVTVACDGMIASSADPMAGLAATLDMIYGSEYTCYNTSAEFVQCSDATGCGLGPAAWAWSYQACTSFLYFPATNNVTDMFPPRAWSLANVTEYCQARWGITPVEGAATLSFGGANIAYGSRIIFSNGLLDPWHGGGFLSSLSDTLVAVLIADGAHHVDLRYSSPADPPSITLARAQEVALLQKWLFELEAQRAAIRPVAV